MVRISFDVSENTRQELKVFAANRGQTIRSLMLWFVDNTLSGKIDPSPLWLGTEFTNVQELIAVLHQYRESHNDDEAERCNQRGYTATPCGCETCELARAALAPFEEES